MRVLVAGNLANMGFEIVKALRKKKVDAKLLMPRYPHKYDDPKFMYPQLVKMSYPDWVFTYDNKNRSFSLNNWKFQVIREMRKDYDAIIALTEFSIFAMFCGKPYGALSTGSDMRELAFENSLKGFLYRLSYKFARLVIWGEPDKFYLVKKLGLERKAVFCTAPRNVNFQIRKIQKDDLKDKFVIFHPASQHWRLKRNNLFLEAFEKLCSERNDVYLIISERGPDLEKAKKILENGNAKNNYKFVPPLDATQMEYHYNLCDVVVDQFGIGSMGMISMEAMKYAKPVILELDEESFRACYYNFPNSLINVGSSNEIYTKLKKLILNPKLCEEIGTKNRKWVDENWDIEKLTNRYFDICEAIKKNDLKIIKEKDKIWK